MYTTKIPECIPQKSRNVYHKNPGMYTTKIPECIPQKLSDEDQLLLQNCETALNYTTNYFLVSVMVMLHRLYAISPLLNFRPTNFPTYCNIGPTPAVYFYIIWGLGKVKKISGLSAAVRTAGQGAKRRGQDRLGGRALRPHEQ